MPLAPCAEALVLSSHVHGQLAVARRVRTSPQSSGNRPFAARGRGTLLRPQRSSRPTVFSVLEPRRHAARGSSPPRRHSELVSSRPRQGSKGGLGGLLVQVWLHGRLGRMS